jgi:metallo-beta-lactamase family protein
MPNQVAAPVEADALRRLAGVMNRVHFPATLLHFLLALLAVLTGTKSVTAQLGVTLAPARTWRTPLRDWQFSPTGETIDDLAPVLHPRALRRLRRGDKPLKPAYTRDDVHKALNLCEAIRYRECFPIAGGTLCFHDAGHILGSAIVELKFTEKGKDKTLVFSGDLGNRDSVLMNDPAMLKQADIVLMEGTYGDRNHRSQQASLVELEAILQETWEVRGNVMIPAFSVGRTQELLFHLGTMAADGRLDNWQVFVDSPMATAVTTLYESCIDLLDQEDVQKMKKAYGGTLKQYLPNLHFTESVEESMAINRVKHGAIIIAGSGMCTGGRIRHHFKQRIWEQRNTIICS